MTKGERLERLYGSMEDGWADSTLETITRVVADMKANQKPIIPPDRLPPEPPTELRVKKKSKVTKFYREDQERDEAGRFADEGGGGSSVEEQDADLTPIEKGWMDEFRTKQAAFVKETGQEGLRYDADLTGPGIPPEKFAEQMKNIAEFRRDANSKMRGMEGYKYLAPEDFVYHEGKAYELPDKPPQIRLMTPKECFSNATMMMLHNPTEYDYVEGYYASSHLPYAIEHAWLVDKGTGKVVDPTLGWQPKAAYYGVRFDKKFVIRKMLQNKYYGIMNNGTDLNDVVLGKDKDFHYAND